MRLSTRLFSVDLPEGFLELPAEQGFDFVGTASGDRVRVTVMAWEDEPAPSELAARAAAEIAGQRANWLEMGQGRLSDTQTATCGDRAHAMFNLHAPEEPVVLFCGVLAAPRAAILFTFFHFGPDLPEVVTARARAAFESIDISPIDLLASRTEDAAERPPQLDRIFPYPVPRGYVDAMSEAAREAARYLGHDVFVVLAEDLDGVCRLLQPDDLLRQSLAFADAMILARSNLERVIASGALDAAYTVEPGLPRYAIIGGHWLAASCLTAAAAWYAGFGVFGTDGILLAIPDRTTLLILPGDTPDPAAQVSLLLGAMGRAHPHKPLTSGLFRTHVNGLRVEPVGAPELDVADPLHVAAEMDRRWDHKDVAGVMELGRRFRQGGGQLTPLLFIYLLEAHLAAGDVGAVLDEALSALDRRDALASPEFASSVAETLIEIGDGARAAEVLRRHEEAVGRMTFIAQNAALRAALLSDRLADAHRLAEDAMERLHASPALAPVGARVLYNAACAYARTGRRARALEAIRRLAEVDPASVGNFATDTDMESLAGDLEFKLLVSGQA